MAKVSDVTGQPSRALLIRTIAEGFDGPSWHGPSVTSTLRGVDSEKALLRAGQGRNSIWEMVLHLAYARHRALIRLAKMIGKPTESFPRKLRKSWWPELPEQTDGSAWKQDRALLTSYHKRLLEILEETPQEVLARHRRKEWTVGTEILGLATHDAYHAGQIRLLVIAAGLGG